MFTLKCDTDLYRQLENVERYYPPEVSQELPQYLEALKRDGGVLDPDFQLGVKRIPARTFHLFYRTDFLKKEVQIVGIRVKPADILRERFKINDDWDDNDVIQPIVQFDVPDKLIRAIELIHQGIQDSYQLGYELGYRGKSKSSTRWGQYTKQALEYLKLIRRTRQGKKLISELTDTGKRIAECGDEQLKVRLMIEAMLHYPPIQEILCVVSKGEEELSIEAIKNIAFHEDFHEIDTSNRRSQTLKSWIKWISDKTGIPICLHRGSLQLTIPKLYEEVNNHES